MKKILTAVFLLLPLISISSVYSDQTKKYDYYVNLKDDYGINTMIHFRRYGIQKILEVPVIEIHTVGKEKILTYRTEFHNGSENGCLKIFNKIKNNKLIPIFVLEELFLLERPWEQGYYQRVLTKFSYNEIEFDLYEIITKGEKKENKILHVILEKHENDFKKKSITEFRKEFSQSASLNFSDVYDSLKERILSGEY